MVVMDEMEAFERLLVWYVPVVTGQVLRGGGCKARATATPVAFTSLWLIGTDVFTFYGL